MSTIRQSILIATLVLLCTACERSRDDAALNADACCVVSLMTKNGVCVSEEMTRSELCDLAYGNSALSAKLDVTLCNVFDSGTLVEEVAELVARFSGVEVVAGEEAGAREIGRQVAINSPVNMRCLLAVTALLSETAVAVENGIIVITTKPPAIPQ